MLTTQPLGVLGTRTERSEGAGIRQLGKYLGRQVWLFNLITRNIQQREETLTPNLKEHVAGVEWKPQF